MKKLSICVLIYKSELFISKCIESLISQTNKDFEIVLIDNACPDESINIAKKLLKYSGFTNFRIVKILNNTGCGQGRTIGYKNSSYDYVMNLDSDDTIPNYFVEEIYKKLREDDYDIISYGHSIVNESDEIIRSIKAYKNEKLIKYTLSMFWRYTFKKELAIKANIDTSNLHYAEDRIFSLRLIPSINKIGIINKNMYFYLKSSNSTTKTINQESYYDSNRIVFNLYSELYNKSTKKEKKYLLYAITKFYISILAMNCKGQKNKIDLFFEKYKKLYLETLNKNSYKIIYIIPKKCFCKETIVIQISYILLKFRFIKIFKYIYKNLY